MIQKLKLYNWKSHAQTELEFKPGVNILVGPMGAGKSSVLQAISFALFGTFSELKSKDTKITDLITRKSQSKRAEIELNLGVSNKPFLVRRQIEINKGTSEATIKDNEGKLLAGPNPTQVSDYVKNTLKLDEDIFLRTIYARQNDIGILLQLTPAERKKRLDGLMGLDRFELVRKNSTKLLNQLISKKETKQSFLKDINIERLGEDIDILDKECNKIKTEHDELKYKITLAHEEKNKAEEQVKELRKKFDEYSKLQERRELIHKQLEEISSSEIALDTTTERIIEQIKEIKTKLSEAERTKQTIKEDLEQNQKKALELEKNLGAFEERYSEITSELENIQKLKKELEELKRTELTFEEKAFEEIEEKIRVCSDRKQFLLGEAGVLRKHLEELEKAEGLCPVCSARLEVTTKENLIKERIQKINEHMEEVNRLAFDIEDAQKKKKKLESVHETYTSYAKRIDSEADLHTKERDLALQLSGHRGKKDALQGISEQMQKRFDDLDNNIRKLETDQTKLVDQKQLCEIKERRDTLQKEISELEEHIKSRSIESAELDNADKKLQECIRQSQELISKQNSLAFILEEKEKRLTDLKDKKEQVSNIKNEIKDSETKIEFLSKFKNALLSAQETLRKELIIAVNEVMGDIWTDLYPYDYWTSIRLQAAESDYILQMKEKEGDWINVAGFASGGERMLACLALRMAFAKVMAPGLSLLILDEPTHNLDDRAIHSFVELLQERLSKFLDQIFIVTHDEKLAEAGENIIKL